MTHIKPTAVDQTETCLTVADALRKFAPKYLADYEDRVPFRHRKVLSLIQRCGTGKLGHAFYRCGRYGPLEQIV